MSWRPWSQKTRGTSPLNELDIDQEEFRAKQEEDPILKSYLSVHRNEVGLTILEGQGQVLVPAPFVPTLLSLAHDATAHQGPKKMLARLEPHYWWPNMKAEIENCAKSCKRCGAMLALHIVHYNYLKPYPVRPEQVENPKKNPRGLPRDDPLSESSDDSEIEIRNNNDRRYPERRRRPPDRYTCD